jgi:hypothetical protein
MQVYSLDLSFAFPEAFIARVKISSQGVLHSKVMKSKPICQMTNEVN